MQFEQGIGLPQVHDLAHGAAGRGGDPGHGLNLFHLVKLYL